MQSLRGAGGGRWVRIGPNSGQMTPRCGAGGALMTPTDPLSDPLLESGRIHELKILPRIRLQLSGTPRRGGAQRPPRQAAPAQSAGEAPHQERRPASHAGRRDTILFPVRGGRERVRAMGPGGRAFRHGPSRSAGPLAESRSRAPELSRNPKVRAAPPRSRSRSHPTRFWTSPLRGRSCPGSSSASCAAAARPAPARCRASRRSRPASSPP